MPLRESLKRIRKILKPHGRLLVLDLYHVKTAGDYSLSAAGMIGNSIMKVIRGDHKNEELRKAWAEHDPLDHYLSMREIKGICQEVLPYARVRRHIYFRYSLIWENR